MASMTAWCKFMSLMSLIALFVLTISLFQRNKIMLTGQQVYQVCLSAWTEASLRIQGFNPLIRAAKRSDAASASALDG